MSSTQHWCCLTWEAAKQCAPEIPLNHCSATGWLLEQFGSAGMAYLFCPPEPWYDVVRGYLMQIMQEESRYALPR